LRNKICRGSIPAHNRAVNFGAGGDGDAGGEALIPGRADFNGFAVAPLFAAEEKAGLRAWAHLHVALLILF
jgi:hypothetical protein